MKKLPRPTKERIIYTVGCTLFCLGLIITAIVLFINRTYNITYQQVLYTIMSPVEGAGKDVPLSCFISALPEIAVMVLYGIFGEIILSKIRKNNSSLKEASGNAKIKKRSLTALISIMAAIGVFSFCFSLWFANNKLNILDYYRQLKNPTTLYENYYTDPNTVFITAPQKKKNLILIYMESMETTYASTDEGGHQPVNYIPNLTQLSKDNFSFSNGQKLGGARAGTGNAWTMGALFATSSGLPFMFSIEGNSMGEREVFAGGVTTIGDILEDNGYFNIFLCGSESEFGGRKKFYEQHGAYFIFDYFSAINDRYIPPGYKVWWGFEDSILYKAAKDFLTQLNSVSDPFNMTILTADTHFTGGYICELCDIKYESHLANVISCADTQINEFIEWCKTQPFYDNTTIVIIGDHPTMEQDLVSDVPYNERTVYNCFINPAVKNNNINLKDRDFTPMDMFPTILSSLGFKIEGDRLGIGTDLFSSTPTLAETMGTDNLYGEISCYSRFYLDTFS